MRQLMVQVPRGQGRHVLELARRHDGHNLAVVPSRADGEDEEIAYVHVGNAEVGPFLDDLEALRESRVTLVPTGALPLSAPSSSGLADYVIDVDPRSPVEIWLSGLQSIGSWVGFIGYAVTAAIVVWIALSTDTVYLLIAGMLIAPLGGPAMNVAIASARGDLRLAGQSLLRYGVALGITGVVSALLTIAFQPRVLTDLVLSVGQVSAVAVLLPVAAGVAAALNLAQSERSSLVFGTAVGFLVAASLAPAAGVIGIASALRLWSLVRNAAFVLALQLVAINLSGSLVFRAYGLEPRGSRYSRGDRWVTWVSLVASAVLLLGLIGWQAAMPQLRRLSQQQRAIGIMQQVVQENDAVGLVAADARIVRVPVTDEELLFGQVYVRPRVPLSDLPVGSEELESILRRAVQLRLLERGIDVSPLVDVTILEPVR